MKQIMAEQKLSPVLREFFESHEAIMSLTRTSLVDDLIPLEQDNETGYYSFTRRVLTDKFETRPGLFDLVIDPTGGYSSFRVRFFNGSSSHSIIKIKDRDQTMILGILADTPRMTRRKYTWLTFDNDISHITYDPQGKISGVTLASIILNKVGGHHITTINRQLNGAGWDIDAPLPLPLVLDILKGHPTAYEIESIVEVNKLLKITATEVFCGAKVNLDIPTNAPMDALFHGMNVSDRSWQILPKIFPVALNIAYPQDPRGIAR